MESNNKLGIHNTLGKTIKLFTIITAIALILNSCDNPKETWSKRPELDKLEEVNNLINSGKLNTEETILYLEQYLRSEDAKNLIKEEKWPLQEKLAKLKDLTEEYKKLKEHIGEEVYILDVVWYPVSSKHVCYSKEECKEYIKDIKNNWNTTVKKITHATLNEKKFQEIIENWASLSEDMTHIEFYRDKFEELEKKRENPE